MGVHKAGDRGDLSQPLLEDGVASAPAQERIEAPPNRDARTLPAGPLPPINTRAQPDLEDGSRQHYADSPLRQQVVLVRRGMMVPAILCPHCGRAGPTIQYKANGFCSCFTAGLCCFLGCCILAPFVFCCDPLKDTLHHCSHCRRYLGRTPA